MTILIIFSLSLFIFTLLQQVFYFTIQWKSYKWFYWNVYLKSYHWKFVRWLKFRQVGRRCEKCGHITSKTPIDVHHRTYKHIWWEMFYLNDLQVLCRYHHLKEHHG